MNAASVSYRLGGFWRALRAAGFWFFMGACVAGGAFLYAGPTRIEWVSGQGLTAEIGYVDEMRAQMNGLMLDVEGGKS